MIGVFYKNMENLIEEFIILIGDGLNIFFINVLEVMLMGVEFEFEKIFDFFNCFQGVMFVDCEWFFKINYIYIQLEVFVEGNVIVVQGVFGQLQVLFFNVVGFIEDGCVLQGQFEYLFNFQVGFEINDGCVCGVFLYNYMGECMCVVVNLFDNLLEIVEQVLFLFDLVYSCIVIVVDVDWDFGFFVCNIFGDDYEVIQFDDMVELLVDIYDVGMFFSFLIFCQW